MAISKRMRYEVMRRDGFKCRYCGHGAGNAALTLDHVVPKVLGGADDPSNLVTACTDCNLGKGTTIPDQLALPGVDESELRRSAVRRQEEKDREVERIAVRLLIGVFDGTWREFEGDSAIPRPKTWRNTLLMFWANGLSGGDMTIAMYNLMDDPRVDRNQAWNQFCRLCWQELEARFTDAGILSLTDNQEVLT